ncbi:MAG: hypothetical protein RBU30_19100, partial [Polyangia bacterium]|nr:hypothetical protein [Polyangia bacterium]
MMRHRYDGRIQGRSALGLFAALAGIPCLLSLGAPGCGQETGPRVAPRGGKVSDPFSTAGGLVEQLGDREFKL